MLTFLEQAMHGFDEIELSIKEILEGIAIEALGEGVLNDGEWTKRIKLKLCRLGHEKGYSVSATGVEEAETGEWLYDLIWAYGEGEPWIFMEMPLALECEWSRYDEDILWDFDKLLIARSKYKIFIFTKKTDNEVNDLFKKLKIHILSFRTTQTGDRYFLAGYSWERNQFIFSSLIA